MCGLDMVSAATTGRSANEKITVRWAFKKSAFLFASHVLTVRCQMIEPLRSANGAPPCIPIISDRSLPTLSTSQRDLDFGSRNDTRLRIFSGTANPALSQEPQKFHLIVQTFIMSSMTYERRYIIHHRQPLNFPKSQYFHSDIGGISNSVVFLARLGFQPFLAISRPSSGDAKRSSFLALVLAQQRFGHS
ncbi:hypothetical protein KSP40_PGU016981 [Platanthera guangdongensis]|uniref:Uncharacterized protein n=1 Tax=Platanthera guangdongensis TaxID=2320717 RepID=A0ABR2LYT4_9ASPA